MRIPALAAAGLIFVSTLVSAVDQRPTHVVAAPQAVFSYVSEAGDLIGQGQSAVITQADADFYVLSTPYYVEVRINLPGQAGWNIRLAPPGLGPPYGTQWTPGRYFEAEWAPLRKGRAPGLDVVSPNGACATVWGEIGLRQIGFDSEGRVTSIEVSFVQHCNSPDAPALAGVIRYKSPQLSFHLVSQAGALTAAPIDKTYYNDSSLFRVLGSLSFIEIGVSGQRDSWGAYIAPPTGKTLKPGTYDTSSLADPTHVGMYFFGDGINCDANSGKLVIHSVMTDATRRIIKLSAEFQQDCAGGSVTGTLHYGA